MKKKTHLATVVRVRRGTAFAQHAEAVTTSTQQKKD
jgi:hypothetical protein